MRMDKIITIQTRDEETEKWTDYSEVLAQINSAKGTEGYGNGYEGARFRMTFTVRYLPKLEKLRETSEARIVYRNVAYNLVGYDDFMESHQTIRLTAESYGGAI